MAKEPSQFMLKINNFIAAHLTRVPLIQRLFFIEHLRVMIGAGLSVVESLEVLGKEIENAKLQIVIHQVKSDVEGGEQLSAAMGKHKKIFPPMQVKMIEAGEVAGRLEGALEQVEIQLKKSHELSSTIRGAMIYPAVILIAMVGVGAVMALYILPKLLVVFEEFGGELPLATRVMIAGINFLQKPLNLALIIIILIGFIIGFITLLRRSIGFKHAIHSMNLHLPIAGKIIKKINLARFSLTLSSLLKSTIPIIDATDITAETCSNVLYKNALHRAAGDIKSGRPLSEILTEYRNLFPPMVIQMIMVGERSGEIDRLLDEVAEYFNAEVTRTMKNFATIIEPVIILLLGVAVAGMAVAVIMPMYSLVQNF